MNDNWLQHPLAAMRAPLPGDQLDALHELTDIPMPQEEQQDIGPFDPAMALAEKIAEQAVKEKALSQRVQLQVAQRNDSELLKGL